MKVLPTLFLASSFLPTSFAVIGETGEVGAGEVGAVLAGLRGSNKVLKGSERRLWLNDGSEESQAATGLIVGNLLIGVSRNPSLKDELKKIAIFGSALAYSNGDIHKVPAIAAQIAEAQAFTGATLDKIFKSSLEELEEFEEFGDLP